MKIEGKNFQFNKFPRRVPAAWPPSKPPDEEHRPKDADTGRPTGRVYVLKVTSNLCEAPAE